jgi:putative nucleotidyltransferase with HDIG domain
MASKNPIDILNLNTNLINHLAIVFRTAEVHSIKNIAVTKTTNNLFLLITSYLKFESPIILELKGDFFFMNEMRIRYYPDVMINFDYLVRLFRSLDLGKLIFHNNISPKDIDALLNALVIPTTNLSFNELKQRLAPVESIDIEQLQKAVEGDLLDARKIVKKAYFKAVSFTKGIMNSIKTNEKIALKKAKRMVVLLVDHIMTEEQILLGMTSIKDYDEYTYHHSVNVSILSAALGQRLGLNMKQLTDLGMVALFHDIGKVVIPNEILNKATPLTDNDWKIIKEHPVEGVHSLLKMKQMDHISIRSAIIAFEHHMFYDNTGYPTVKSPFDLDLYSRIVSIADQYDAMTSSRVYSRKAMAPDKALCYMMKRSGIQLDPLIFKIFVNMVGVFPIGTLVILDSNEMGLVYESNPSFIDRPRIKIITDPKGKQISPLHFDLAEKNPAGEFKKSIVKTINANKYKINIADYLM